MDKIDPEIVAKSFPNHDLSAFGVPRGKYKAPREYYWSDRRVALAEVSPNAINTENDMRILLSLVLKGFIRHCGGGRMYLCSEPYEWAKR